MTVSPHPRLTGAFNELEKHFADLMEKLCGNGHPELWLAAALLSRRMSCGHVCLDLREWSSDCRHPSSHEFPAPPPLALWLEHLKKMPVVGEPGTMRPLILDAKHRLYLLRYFNYERELIEKIIEMTSSEVFVKESLLAQGLHRLFPDRPADGTDWQQVAAAVALLKPFSIITGGPGSGKTSIVFRVLLLLLEQFAEKTPRIFLTAPTGKAAARLKETIRSWRERFKAHLFPSDAIPDEVYTLHRLLGYNPLSGACRYHRDHPLPCDLLVIDEASMVDLPLLVRTVRSLPKTARLILLGDRDQLASVETGAVLSDLCGARRQSAFTAAFSSRLSKLLDTSLPLTLADHEMPFSILSDSLVFLQKSYRFDDQGGLGKAARLVNDGRGRDLADFLSGSFIPGCRLHSPAPPQEIAEAILGQHEDHFHELVSSPDPLSYLKIFSRFAVLCALRQGPWGAHQFNLLMEQALWRRGLIPSPRPWYHGRPIMIAGNDYRLGLYNGDLGVIFRCAGDNRLMGCFPTADGGMLRLSPSRLPAHETAFAMTIHKSQGSEFDAVFLLLPPHFSEVLSAELIYTGLTRARREAAICASKEVLTLAVERRIKRSSGLSEPFRAKGPNSL